MKPKIQKGFTIVELLVVMVVIAILATITVFTYNGLTHRAREAKITSDLRTTSEKVNVDSKVGQLKYPESINYTPDAGYSFGYYKLNDGASFCLEMGYREDESLQYHYKAFEANIERGLCSGGLAAIPEPPAECFQTSYTPGGVVINRYTGVNGGYGVSANPNCPLDVTIPTHINSQPVVVIERFAFAYTGLTSVVIPSSVASIEDYAFYGCNLTTVTIPSTTHTVGPQAFDSGVTIVRN